MSRDGFTVVELMVGAAVIGILAVASVPNISSYMRSRGATSSVDQVSAHLRLARSRAVVEGNDYIVEFINSSQYRIIDDDGGANGVAGAAGFVQANRGNGLPDAGERVMGPYELAGGIEFDVPKGTKNPFTNKTLTKGLTFPVANGNPAVTFDATGTASSGGYVAISPSGDVYKRSSGRTRVIQVLRSTGSVSSRRVGS